MSQDDCDNENCASTQFLQIHKNQLIDQQETLEHYCNLLPVFGFNGVKYDLNLIKSFLLLNVVNERDIEPIVIMKRTNSSCSDLVIFSYWIKRTFLTEQKALIHSRRHTKFHKQKGFPLRMG